MRVAVIQQLAGMHSPGEPAEQLLVGAELSRQLVRQCPAVSAETARRSTALHTTNHQPRRHPLHGAAGVGGVGDRAATHNGPDAELRGICSQPLVAAFPVPTVAVGRAVKAVAGAASAVLGEQRRHDFISSRLGTAGSCPASAANNRL